MKKCRTLFFILTLLFSCLVPLTAIAEESADSVELILHKRIYRDVRAPDETFYQNDGQAIDEATATGDAKSLLEKTKGLNGANFSVYDASSLYQSAAVESGFSPKAFVEKFSNMRLKEARKYASEQGLKLVGQSPNSGSTGMIKTRTDASFNNEDGIGRITVPKQANGKPAAYLIIEEKLDANKDLNVDLEKKSSPLMVLLPVNDPITKTELDQIHLYPKNVGYVRDPYFFKYGRSGTQEVPLKGAKFALFQYDDSGKKLYLDLNPVTDLKNSWVESSDPLADTRVNIFTSDENGLVNTGERFLPSGTYYFEELQSVAGYELNEASKKIEVVIPESWYDEEGNFQYVKIDGQRMEELVSGKVPDNVSYPRVYNYATSTDPSSTTPSSPTPNGPGGGTGGNDTIGGSGINRIIPVVTQSLARWLPVTAADQPASETSSRDVTPSSSSTKRGLLPQTGEQKMMISLLGLILVIISWTLLKRRRKMNQQNMH